MSPNLSIVPAGSRTGFLDLLLLADESEHQVRDYMDRGDLYVYAIDGAAVGLILALPMDAGAIEIKAVAVQPTQQSRGIGKRMLADVLAHLRQQGCKRAIVGTASAGIGQLAYYQKAGFRMYAIERDFFTPARGYRQAMMEDGIRVLDMVWMDIVP